MTAGGGGGGGGSLGTGPTSQPIMKGTASHRSCGGAGGGTAGNSGNSSGDGRNGRDGNDANSPALGGIGGTNLAAGTGGIGDPSPGNNGMNALVAQGGDGGFGQRTIGGTIYVLYGGGGGGGYFGGGGGGVRVEANAGNNGIHATTSGVGGGGASYVAPGVVVNWTMQAGNACNAGANYAPFTSANATGGGYPAGIGYNAPDPDLPNYVVGYGASYSGTQGASPVGGNGIVLLYW